MLETSLDFAGWFWIFHVYGILSHSAKITYMYVLWQTLECQHKNIGWRQLSSQNTTEGISYE